MTRCVLYGLTLTRTLQGAIAAAAQLRTQPIGDMRLTAASYELLLFIPVVDLILSGVFIYMSMEQTIPGRSVANLAMSILCYAILGGHGLRAAERNGEDK